MKKILALAAMFAAMMLSGNVHAGLLIAGWDFQTAPGTAVAVSPNTPKQYTASFGVGTMYLNSLNGSSDWFVPTTGSTNTELNGFAGTAVNAGTGFSTTTTSPAALAFLGGLTSGGTSAANGKHAVFSVSMAGFENLVISYATQRTTTGFTHQDWSFSSDGTNWTPFQTITGIPSSFTGTTLNTISGLDNVATAFVRLTLTGASASAGNNRIDNIQFNATAIPEPTAMLMVGMAITGCVVRRRRVL